MSAPGANAAPPIPSRPNRSAACSSPPAARRRRSSSAAFSIRRLAEAGVHAPAAVRDCPATPLPSEPEPEPAARFLRQEIHFCTASDGTSLAYSVTGDGPPLVKSANWLNHLEHDLGSPIWRHWIKALTHIRSVWRYDERGNGLSDWHAPLNFEAFVDDLESVVDAAGLDRFDLLGISQGAAVAIAYAVRHPERVRKMHLWGGYALGWVHRGDPQEIERREAMLDLTRHGWALDNPAYRQLFTSLYLPGGSQEQEDYFNEMQRVTTSAENAVALQQVFAEHQCHRTPQQGHHADPGRPQHPRRRRPLFRPAGRWPHASPAPASSPSKAPTTCCWRRTPAGRNTHGSWRNF